MATTNHVVGGAPNHFFIATQPNAPLLSLYDNDMLYLGSRRNTHTHGKVCHDLYIVNSRMPD